MPDFDHFERLMKSVLEGEISIKQTTLTAFCTSTRSLQPPCDPWTPKAWFTWVASPRFSPQA